jgi:hypothetical protein
MKTPLLTGEFLHLMKYHKSKSPQRKKKNMNGQTPLNNPESAPLSRHEAHQLRREARHEILGGGGSLTWIAGILLILLGVSTGIAIV